MKNPMDLENVLIFFEDNYGIKFIDIKTKKPVLEIITRSKVNEERSDFDLWLDQQDKETQLIYKMSEI